MTPIHNFNPPDSGRQAPSEKHLEDYVWKHPEALGVWDIMEPGDTLVYQFKWRQVRLPSGIVDLVGSYLGISLAIVELKRGPIDAAAFAQLMRYMRDFKAVLFDTLSNYYAAMRPEWHALARHPLVDGTWEDTMLQGVLIGQGCKDDNLLIACDACNVDVYFYTFSDGTYEFEEEIRAKGDRTIAYHDIIAAAGNGIADELFRFINAQMEVERDTETRRYNQEFDAVKTAEQYLNNLDGAA